MRIDPENHYRRAAAISCGPMVVSDRQSMCAERTAEESRQHAIDAMGEDLGRFYHALSNELAWVYLKWGEYVALFGTKPSRIDLLNKAAGNFFRIIQDGLWEDVLLHIARLTDSPRSMGSMGKENLSIRGLPPFITKPEVRETIQGSIVAALTRSEFARDWRNRHIAHKNLKLALADGAEPLISASRAAVKDALAAIADVLNTLSREYLDSTTMLEGLGAYRGAESLLYVLDGGLRAEQERRDRLETGEHRVDDYAKHDL